MQLKQHKEVYYKFIGINLDTSIYYYALMFYKWKLTKC